jgi:hypothetical protein
MVFYFYIPEGICFARKVRKVNKNSEADSFRNIKVNYHTHLKMAM